jgi:hypothetical protein
MVGKRKVVKHKLPEATEPVEVKPAVLSWPKVVLIIYMQNLEVRA